ncbi:hypothetical protein ALC60_02916 [Trachymyrmex zeteki]|nr:hypothetical protein ALC60_02916 [Trachymyrmex zeteki]
MTLPPLNNIISSPIFTSPKDKQLLKLESDTCKFISTHSDIMFTHADKGNVTVAMDKDTYINKMTTLLNDSDTYITIKKDPTKKLTTALRCMLTIWKRNDYINDSKYRELYCSDGLLPRVYGLPKLLKTKNKCVLHEDLLDNVCTNESASWLTVPFIPLHTEKFKRLNNNDIRVSFRSPNKIGKYIKVQKDKCPPTSKRNVVYKISCNNCDVSYVGQTGRQLKTRIAEHRNHIKYNTSTRSVITEHRLQYDHDFQWDNVRVLDEEPCYRKRLTSEMLNIKKQTVSLNLQTDTEGLHKAYIPIINKL